jgi:hypothetical protein
MLKLAALVFYLGRCNLLTNKNDFNNGYVRQTTSGNKPVILTCCSSIIGIFTDIAGNISTNKLAFMRLKVAKITPFSTQKQNVHAQHYQDNPVPNMTPS